MALCFVLSPPLFTTSYSSYGLLDALHCDLQVLVVEPCGKTGHEVLLWFSVQHRFVQKLNALE